MWFSDTLMVEHVFISTKGQLGILSQDINSFSSEAIWCNNEHYGLVCLNTRYLSWHKIVWSWQDSFFNSFTQYQYLRTNPIPSTSGPVLNAYSPKGIVNIGERDRRSHVAKTHQTTCFNSIGGKSIKRIWTVGKETMFSNVSLDCRL